MHKATIYLNHTYQAFPSFDQYCFVLFWCSFLEVQCTPCQNCNCLPVCWRAKKGLQHCYQWWPRGSVLPELHNELVRPAVPEVSEAGDFQRLDSRQKWAASNCTLQSRRWFQFWCLSEDSRWSWQFMRRTNDRPDLQADGADQQRW